MNPLLTAKLGKVTLSEKLVFSMIRNFLNEKGFKSTALIYDTELGEKDSLQDNQVAEILAKNRPGFLQLLREGRSGSDKDPLLQKLVDGLLADKLEKYDTATQTVSSYNDYDVDQKLQMVEEFHLGKVRQESRSAKQVFEDRLKELEEKMKVDLGFEVARIRDIESVKIRAEESAKWREKYQAERDEMERAFNAKLQGLRQLERKALEQYTEKVRRLEEDHHNKTVSQSRHNTYVEKETGLRHQEITFEKNDLERQRISLNQLERDLKKRADDQLAKEKTFEQRLKNEVDNYKAVTLKEISDKRDQIDAKLNKLNEELNNIAEMRRRMDNLAERNLKLETALEDERRVGSSHARETRPDVRGEAAGGQGTRRDARAGRHGHHEHAATRERLREELREDPGTRASRRGCSRRTRASKT